MPQRDTIELTAEASAFQGTFAIALCKQRMDSDTNSEFEMQQFIKVPKLQFIAAIHRIGIPLKHSSTGRDRVGLSIIQRENLRTV